MRINDNLLTKTYTILSEARRVSKLSVTEAKFKDVCHTINVINGLSYGKAIVGEYLLEDYEIPSKFAELIVPCRIKFSSDETALDFKSSKYADSSLLVGGKVLSPTEFKLAWMAILGALKSNDTFTNVKAHRADKILSDMTVQMVKEDNSLCRDVGVYVPVLVTQNFYVDQVYNVSIEDMFEKWFLNQVATA